MPPKRRKAPDSGEEPEPKRRVTRSASKTAASATPATESGPPAANKEPSKRSKSTTKSPSSTPKKVASIARKNKPNGYPALTIEHESMKKPIPCHEYTARSHSDSTISTSIFTHGAGGTLSAPAVVNFCTGYSRDSDILAFQGAMNLKARVKAFHACISGLHKKGDKLVLGGRSMGARAAALAATDFLASEADCDVSVILVSYPLQSGDAVRDSELVNIPSKVRVLFIIGEKDAMCPLDKLGNVRKKMDAESTCFVVKGADHGMHIGGVTAEEEKRLGEETGSCAVAWVNGGGEQDGHVLS